jgi:hypothetical protein
MSATGNKEISRFVCIDNRNSYCRTSDGTVKPNAFKPNKNGETSVFVNCGLAEAEIWQLGIQHVCTSQKPLYGRADVAADIIVHDCNLKLDKDDSPKGHVNIVNWPRLDDKEKIQQLALVLAAAADCHQFS